MIAATEQDRQSIFGDLAQVGKTKSMGYLPIATVEEFLDLDLREVAGSLEQRGLRTKVFQPDECCIKGGALYVCDVSALQNILDAASDVLERNAWPVTAEMFVERAAKAWIDESDPVHGVIRRAFGEFP